MAHMMKHTKASAGHMFAHFDRKAANISNENLDRSRTNLNYNLAAHQTLEQGEFVRKRCGEVRCQNRKDVNIMVTWVVTVPQDLPPEEHDAFFAASYDFLEQRYGRNNVISAYVHMDEVTPHMHFAFVPIVEDKKRGGYKVSAKEAVPRFDLQRFHADLSTYLEGVLGHKVAVLNGSTEDGNKSIEELKRKSASERLSEALQEVEAVKEGLIPVQAEYEAKKAYIRASDDISAVSMQYPPAAKVSEKGLIHKQKYVTVPAEMWEAKHISANEKQVLEQATQALERRIKAFQCSTSAEYISNLQRRIKTLEQTNVELNTELSAVKSDYDSLEYFCRNCKDKNGISLFAQFNRQRKQQQNRHSSR